jgi:hypothetical protein
MCDRTFWQEESVVSNEYFCLFTKSFLRRLEAIKPAIIDLASSGYQAGAW